jgi:hypothetical protein
VSFATIKEQETRLEKKGSVMLQYARDRADSAWNNLEQLELHVGQQRQQFCELNSVQARSTRSCAALNIKKNLNYYLKNII